MNQKNKTYGGNASVLPMPFQKQLLYGNELRSRMPSEFNEQQRAMARFLAGKGMTDAVALTSRHLPSLPKLRQWLMEFVSKYYAVEKPADTDLIVYVAYEPNKYKGFHAHLLFNSPGGFNEPFARDIWSGYGGKNKRSLKVQEINGDERLFNYIAKDLHRPSADFDVYTQTAWKEDEKARELQA